MRNARAILDSSRGALSSVRGLVALCYLTTAGIAFLAIMPLQRALVRMAGSSSIAEDLYRRTDPLLLYELLKAHHSDLEAALWPVAVALAAGLLLRLVLTALLLYRLSDRRPAGLSTLLCESFRLLPRLIYLAAAEISLLSALAALWMTDTPSFFFGDADSEWPSFLATLAWTGGIAAAGVGIVQGFKYARIYLVGEGSEGTPSALQASARGFGFFVRNTWPALAVAGAAAALLLLGAVAKLSWMSVVGESEALKLPVGIASTQFLVLFHQCVRIMSLAASMKLVALHGRAPDADACESRVPLEPDHELTRMGVEHE